MADSIPGTVLRALVDSTAAAFQISEIKQLIRLAFDESLDNLVKPGSASSVIYELFLWSEREGVAEKLVAELVKERPKSKGLAAAAKELGIATSEPPTVSTMPPEPPPGAIRNGLSTVSPDGVKAWADGMMRASRAVCLVENGGAKATGLLIGPRLLLTVYHALAREIEGAGDPANVKCRFNFLEGRRSDDERHVVPLADEWLVEVDREQDFAVLLLQKPKCPVEWLRPSSEELVEGQPLFTLGHIQGRTAEMECVWYTNGAADGLCWYENDGIRKPGTSGAPVCTSNWELVAIHHAVRPHPDGWEHGVIGGQGVDVRPIFKRRAVRVAIAIGDT